MFKRFKSFRESRNGTQSDSESECSPLLCRQFRHWSAYGLGEALMQQELDQLQKDLPTIFGYYLLHIGNFTDNTHFGSSYITSKIVVDGDTSNRDSGAHTFAQPDQLPVATDSVDLVILQHCLETSSNPHEVLREVDRVLVPEGHVIVLGFNPISMWGLRRLFSFNSKRMPWNGHFISPFRIKDWLRLLGYDVLNARTFYFKPPVSHARLAGKLVWMERLGEKLWPAFGGAYIFLARKRVSTLTMIKPRKPVKKPILAQGLVETRQ